MGVDIYLEWDGKPEPKEGVHWDHPESWGSINNGKGVYIRESYFSGRRASEVLMPESYATSREEWFKKAPGPWGTSLATMVREQEQVATRCTWNEEGDVHIPVDLLRSRLEGTEIACMERYPDNAEYGKEHFEQFVEFVDKYEELESAGMNPRIVNSY